MTTKAPKLEIKGRRGNTALCWREEIQSQVRSGITEWFGLEGTLKIIYFQPPCHGQGHLPLDQVAQSPIQPGLEGFGGF